MEKKFVLVDTSAQNSTTAEELAKVIIERIGLHPRKKGATDKVHTILLELYERAKKATAHKDPKLSIMSVEEMALFASITRQTMYEYLHRWTESSIITKVSFIDASGKVTIGYKLSGANLEEAFTKVESRIRKHLDTTRQLLAELQKRIKNEKISASMVQQKLTEVSDETSLD